MKILITGASGQLGRQLKNDAPENFHLYLPNRNELDLSNPKECFEYVENLRPDWIINSGAYTNVDLAESEISYVMKINYEAPLYFSKALKKYGGNLLHISTDYVFDGKNKTPYLINYKRNPINIYGKSKMRAEKSIEDNLAFLNQSVIVRTSWIVSPYRKNFVLTMVNLHKIRDEIKVVSDQLGCLTNAKDLSITCWEIISNWQELKNINNEPILKFHFSNDGIISWFDIAKAIGDIGKDIGLIDFPAKVLPINTDQYPTLAKRPAFSVLDNTLTKEILNINIKNWKDALKEILEEIQNNLII